ncbi:MalM family protein [Photobacterium sp. ZSDE20]|uniref:MalM family protein n=1 Tax=Photobacterium pectinilyticum TaxID=2906793 RepID=A0ABT1N139_9GAMM|nr:MalM family protein [Photobacterium sp. ZSDE20]MCQ1058458.1 MalM family protein [Photobacterium sp. ZSDE20]MDD1823181.1 MalM family protein [Photobacterium sp. ZSDE20]
MKRKQLATILLGLSLTACSSIPDTALNTDLSQSVCCDSVAELAIQPLALDSQQYVTLDGNSETLPLTSARTPVQAYALSQVASPFLLTVRAPIKDSEVIAPAVAIYDRNWNLVEQYTTDDFHYFTSDLSGVERIEGKFILSTQLNQQAYMVVQNDPTQIGNQLTRIHPEQEFAESQHIIGSKRLPLVATLSPVGIVEITTQEHFGNPVVDMLANLTAQKASTTAALSVTNVEQDIQPASSVQLQASHADTQNWHYFKQHIDQAMNDGKLKQAVDWANLAEEAGHSQAKDYLLDTLTQ